MALKSLIFASILIAAMAALMGEAQGGGGGLIGSLLGLIHIEDTMFCSVNGNRGANGDATPVFPNAELQLQCGGEVVSSATTSESGSFSMVLDPLHIVLYSLLNDCCLVLKTPLANCNSKLPSAVDLISPLMIIGNTLLGFLLKPTGFQSMHLPSPDQIINH